MFRKHIPLAEVRKLKPGELPYWMREVFDETKWELAQAAWDRGLISNWLAHSPKKVTALYTDLARDFSFDLQSGHDHLQRIPFGYEKYLTANRYIAKCFPKTNKLLYEGASAEAALKCLSTESRVTTPLDFKKIRLEGRLRAEGRRTHDAIHQIERPKKPKPFTKKTPPKGK